MKLLFDENLSPKLAASLADIFPGSNHVEQLSLGKADDWAVWEYAKKHGYTIVTRDSDYNDISVVKGHPPFVVWIRRGNCSTKEIENIIRIQKKAIHTFINQGNQGIIILL